MNSKLTYIMVFALAFLFTTLAIYILNQKYVNVFKLDLRPTEDYRVRNFAEVNFKTLKFDEMQEYTDKILNNMKEELYDSLRSIKEPENVDTTQNKSNLDSVLVMNLQRTLEALEEKNKTIEEQQKQISSLIGKKETSKDSIYEEWKATTVKLYESMPTNQAAKLIHNFSDSEARDIIYTMKKKKAAQILALLNPEFVYRITKAE